MRFPLKHLIPVSVVALAAGLASAHPHPRRGAVLTPEQRDQVRAIFDKARGEGLADATAKSREAGRELRRLLRDSETSESQLRDAFKRAAAAREEAFILRRKAWAEARSVLTDEQRKLLQERRTLRRWNRRQVL